MRKFLLTSLFVVASGILPARALVLWNLDNSANQTDPGTGAPWGAVAKVVNSNGSLFSGSAIYLGDGFLLTANHVTMNLTYSFITFDEVEFFSIDPTFNDGTRSYGKQVTNGVDIVDMAVFKLTSIPASGTAATLLPSASESFGATNSATMVGWGVGRDPSIPVASTNVTWGNNSTSDKRWGVNAPRGATTISYSAGQNYSYDSVYTYAGIPTGNPPSVRGLGDSESAATLYDSGSGLFQNISNSWYLIGLTTTVQNNGTSRYAADANGGGDANYFARISSYEQQIAALIPEPSTYALLALGTAAVGLAFLRRR